MRDLPELQIDSAAVCVECGEMVHALAERDRRGDYECENCGFLTAEQVQEVYPCARCGWKRECGDPPGEDCHT